MANLLRIRQQTRHDVMLQLSTSDCDELLAALGNLERTGQATVRGDVHASSFKVRRPRVLTVKLVPTDADAIRMEGNELVWSLEADTREEIAEKIKLARRTGAFAIAELATVMGPNREWLRLYVEMQ